MSVPAVLDTCESGDIESVGMIDWMLSSGVSAGTFDMTHLLEGVFAGQRPAVDL